jgi:peptidoglycan hydrolase-like protein with peptidoglycan-binding domain
MISLRSFVARLRRPPQDEVASRMATRLSLMLRCAAQRRLEGRTAAGPALLAIILLLAATPAWAQACRVDFAPGLEASALRDIQAQLKAHGFDPGPVDGVLGPRTCNAVRAYQKAAGLQIDGIIDPKLQNHMHFIAKKGS